MKLRITLLLVVGLMIAPAIVQARAFVRWHTSMGSFTAELYDEIVPITANNFISLSNSGFYNNLIFHRIIAGFMIQDGDPLGTGYGGPGYTIPDEFSPLLLHNQAGILAMARTSAPNSAGSQYYITLAPQPHLDGGYAVFGKIIEGLPNVMAIGSVPVGTNNLPLTPVNIYQIRVLDLHISSVFPDNAETVLANPTEPLMFIVEAETQSAQLSFSWYIDEALQSNQDSFIFEPTITALGNHTVRCNIASSDSVSHNVSWNVVSGSGSVDDSSPALEMPALHCYPNPFMGNLDIEYTLKQPASVSFEIYNLRGQKVRSFSPLAKTAGTWQTAWDTLNNQGQACPAGIYIIRMKAGTQSVISKNILRK
ncbi:MAG: peptidylprolyl isomerase [Candidatus Cloacimonas sp.]|jgi:cyclophilin family peptidyl-prolyl cis-trans isomerase|nr:peptidylprolyl isomerase [Candidatus Cloacimonas sp.]